MINIDKIKKAAIKGISLKPTEITLYRSILKPNINLIGSVKEEVEIGTYNVFVDDSKKNISIANGGLEEAGEVFKVLNIFMLIVISDNVICKGDYFILDNNKYTVLYPGELVKDVYNADIEMIGNYKNG